LTILGKKRTEPRKGLKRTAIRKVSFKQTKRNRELAKIKVPEDGRCENCGQLPDFRGLQKHHKLFRSHLGRDNKSNIEWLCGKCHHARHGIYEIGD
jgi:hypothetical protein